MRIAAVDIGTNTLLMLIVQRNADGSLTFLHDEHRIVRLGEALHDSGSISDAALQRAEQCLAEYRQLCVDFHVDHFVGVCTSAVRRSSNQAEVMDTLSRSFGHPLHCISGDEEARLTFLGSALPNTLCTVIDIGGGSTEIVVGIDSKIHSRISLEIGAVRLREDFLSVLPCSSHTQELAVRHVKEILLRAQAPPVASSIVAVAGTPTTLSAMELRQQRFDAKSLDGFVLQRAVVEKQCAMLLSSSLDQIMAIPGVHPQRADILPAGALILQQLMETFSLPNVQVSTRGLRFGVALDEVSRILR